MAMFSKPVAIDVTCYELGHCWSPYCVKATRDVATSIFRESLKIYGTLYLLAGLMRRKGTKYFLKKFILETLQSTVFLTVNGSVLVTLFCVWRKLAGSYYYFNSFILGLPACAMSLLIERKHRRILGGYFSVIPFLSSFCASIVAIFWERKSRRGLLAVYLTNLALETAFRMAKHRGLVKPIKNGEVLLFSVASAVYFYFFRRKSGLPSSTVSGLKYVVGSSELPVETRSNERSSNNNEEPQRSRLKTGLAAIDKTVDRLAARLVDGPRHRTCQHQHGCVLYVLKGFNRLFGLGYVIQACIRVLSSMRRFPKQPSLLLTALVNKDNFRLGAFLGSFSGIFRFVNCIMRWIRDRDDSFHGLISGFLAGWSMLWYKSTTIALYTFTKMAEMLYFKGINCGYLPYIKCADVLIYAVSTAFALHAAIMEPHTLRPAYWNFLQRITDNRFGLMNRKLLDVYGTKASSMFPDYWPDLDPRFSKLKRPTS